MQMSQQIQTGNALDSAGNRGWFVGHFINKSLGLRHTNDVELKWGVHKSGEHREDWVTGETRTAIALLISGKVEFEFRDKSIDLVNAGDYVMWGKGADHRWRAIDDSVVLTVRWPSKKL